MGTFSAERLTRTLNVCRRLFLDFSPLSHWSTSGPFPNYIITNLHVLCVHTKNPKSTKFVYLCNLKSKIMENITPFSIDNNAWIHKSGMSTYSSKWFLNWSKKQKRNNKIHDFAHFCCSSLISSEGHLMITIKFAWW